MIRKTCPDYMIQIEDSSYTIEESEFVNCIRIRRIDKDGYSYYLRTEELYQIFKTLEHLNNLCQKYKRQLNEYEYAAKIMKKMIDGVD